MNAHQVWQTALGELRGAMAPAAFDTWVRHTLALGQAGGSFTIVAPNTVAREWLRTHVRGQIEATLARVLGRPVALAVVVEGFGRDAGAAGHRPDGALDPAQEAAAAGAWGVEPRAAAPDRIWIEDDLLRAGYTECFNVLLPARAIGACDKIVFFGVLSFAWQDDAAWPSIEALSARVGLSRRAVLYALAELKRVGLLKVRRRGQGYTNLYEIPRITQALLERIEAVEPDEPVDEPAEDEDLVVIEDLTEAAGVTRLSNLVLTARGLDATDKLVYVGLRSFAMRKARCRLKMRTLAGRIGMSERTVETHIGRLRAAGLVTRRRRGLGRANVYTLVRIHPAVLEAIQEPRYVAPPLPADLPDDLVDRCTLCRRPIAEPAPVLEAILRCSACRSAAGFGAADFVQNGNPCTSRSDAHGRPDQDGKACTSGSARPANPEVRALPSHAEDPDEEDPNEERGPPPDVAGAAEDPAALVWRAALAELEGVVSVTALETCFRGTEAVSWVGDTLTVAAPHRFAQEWIDVRYRLEAEAALRRVLARVSDLVERVPELVVEVRRPSVAAPRPTAAGSLALGGRPRRAGAPPRVPATARPPAGGSSAVAAPTVDDAGAGPDAAVIDGDGPGRGDRRPTSRADACAGPVAAQGARRGRGSRRGRAPPPSPRAPARGPDGPADVVVSDAPST